MAKLSMSYRNFIILITVSTYMCLFGLWVCIVNRANIDNYATMLFPWIIIALVIQLCGFVIVKKVPMVDLGLWFLVLSYLFMYGYLFIDFFGMQSKLLWTPIKEYSQSILFDAASFVNLSLNAFTIGYLLSYKDIPSKTEISDKRGVLSDREKYNIGILLFVIGGICQLITSFKLVMVTQTAGSYTAYSQAASSGILDDVSFLFIPGVVYILASKRLNNTKAFVFSGIIAVYFCVVMLLSGSRKTQIFGITAVMLCYLYTYKPPKFRLYKKILIVLGGIVFLNMIYVIRENRMDLSNVVPAFFASLTNWDFLLNLIPEIFAETGITFCSVASVMRCVPEVFPHEYGFTVVRSAISILPIGWLMPDFFAKASTTTTVNTFLKLPVGASLFGDFYWNWGMFGIAVALVFGILLSGIAKKLHRSSNEVYFSIFYILLMGVRAGIFEIARPLFIVLFMPWLFGIILKNGRRVV